ncbi:hypothetical protein J1N35_045923 [Gossypium stocksii]|uniref:RNase H type-1 domain-containing protein n=1 Tax=Gossypium stocksii TaxID=47602 RepID=A0A9D3UC79_9ROSI|nr:hypothetical protein J1N35_045923 [Gossypium stocksii]
MGMRKVILEVDCLELVQFLCSSVQVIHHHDILRSITEVLQRQWEVRVVHVFVDGNRLPDGMPALAFNPSIGLQIFSVPPEEDFSILLDDRRSMDST